MRNVKITTGDNWKSLDINYEFDDRVKFDNSNVISTDGVTLNLNSTLSNNVDISNNNYSTMMMSDLTRVSDIVSLDLDTDRYPEQFTTSIVFDAFPSVNGGSKYLKVLPRTDDSDVRDIIFGNTTINNTNYTSFYYDQDPTDDNGLYFNVNLIDNDTLTISHNDNYANVYLTMTNDGDVTLETAPLDTPSEDQKFNYILNNNSGELILLKYFDGVKKYVGSNGTNITPILPDTSQPNFPFSGIIKIIPYDKTASKLTIPNNWVSYKTSGDQNNLKINESKSYENIFSNYVFSNQYASITGANMNMDLMQLKNQLTSSYESNRGNPFPNYTECDHREYDRIFTGTNQIKGLSDIHFGYNSYSTDINIPVDKITYFHAPQDMYPYEKININDSGLIEAGAIGGDSPITSDKLFKKAADYKYNSPYGAPTDEETGVWLCTWLKSSIESPWDSSAKYDKDILVSFKNKVYQSLKINTGVIPSTNRLTWVELPEQAPVWVDRYYNPEHFSVQQALEFTEQYVVYKSKFDHIVTTLSAQQDYIFDKLSDVTFEPGALYAYYRVGPIENNITINSMDTHLVHRGQEPVYEQDRSTYINTDEALTFNGNTYIETVALNNTKNSDYTVSFNLSLDDWNKPFGGQFLGNYTNHGIGFYNLMHTTPYIIIKGATSTDIYNTNLDIVLSGLPVAIDVVHGTGNENIHILTGSTGDYEIRQYDTTGMLVEKTPLAEITTEIISMNIDNDSIYLLDINNNIYRYDINNELIDQLLYPYPGVIGDGGSDTYMDTFRDYEYRINCDTYTTDISGSVWYKRGDEVMKYTQSNKLGQNATYENTISSVNVSLIASERKRGAQGNSIIISGDNTSTLSSLVEQWNNSNGGNQVQIISGDDSKSLVLSSSQQIQLYGGINQGTPTINIALSAQPGDEIVNIKSDENNNIWTIIKNDTESKIFKIDNDRNILYSNSLSAIDSTLQYHMSGNVYMDIISEFNSGVYDNSVVILNQDTTDDTLIRYTKLNNDGSLKETTTKTIPQLAGINVNNLHNITNYETVKRLHNDIINTNHITFKTRLQSYFDTDKTYTQLLKYDVTRLTPGYHHFVASFNSTNGNMSLFVDGDLQKAVTSDDIYTGAAYKYSKTIHNPLMIGTEPYFNNITFNEHLGMNGYSFISNCTIQNIRVYNEALNFHKVRALTREIKTIQDLCLTLPTGKRSYIDQVKSVYKHQTPGRKSTDFNIDIISKTLTGDDIKQQISTAVIEDVKTDLPVNSTINKINWIN
jgi:hypothetical protein